MIKTIMFDKPTYRDSIGRNGYLTTAGVEIFDTDVADIDSDRENSVMLSPITSRGKTSGSCRLSIAKSAIPDLIEALQKVLNT